MSSRAAAGSKAKTGEGKKAKKGEGKKATTKAPKIQRLVTPQRLQRKRFMVASKRSRATKARDLAAAYQALLAQKAKAKAEANAVEKERKRTNSTRNSESSK